MKKFLSAAMTLLMLFAMGTGAYALVAAGNQPEKNPPVFISELTVSDAWMSGLTKTNWQRALVEQTYVEGSYIWFIAKISVSACDDTESGQLWTNGDEEASLTVTSKDNCLDFAGAAFANFTRIQGMDVMSEQVDANNSNLVDARAERAIFNFGCLAMSYPPTMLNDVLVFTEDLAHLKMDGIYPEDYYGKDSNYATLQKDYYLHFMATANAATEGVCIATMKVNDTDAHTFLRDPETEGENAVYTSERWWEVSSPGANSQLHPGNRSYIYRFDNTINGKIYSIMRIDGEAVSNSRGYEAPFEGTDSIYVIMNDTATTFYIGFAVESSGRIQGLVYWRSGKHAPGNPGAFTSAYTKSKTWDAANYNKLITNTYGEDLTAIGENIAINATELRAIFSYFGISRSNPAYVSDMTFLAPGSGRAGASRVAKETSAEARYNVSSGNSDLDSLFVVPNTGAAKPAITPAPTPTPDALSLPVLPIHADRTPAPTLAPTPTPTPRPTPTPTSTPTIGIKGLPINPAS